MALASATSGAPCTRQRPFCARTSARPVRTVIVRASARDGASSSSKRDVLLAGRRATQRNCFEGCQAGDPGTPAARRWPTSEAGSVEQLLASPGSRRPRSATPTSPHCCCCLEPAGAAATAASLLQASPAAAAVSVVWCICAQAAPRQQLHPAHRPCARCFPALCTSLSRPAPP